MKRGHSLRQRIARHLAFTVLVSLLASAVILIAVRHRSLVRSTETSATTYSALISQPLVKVVEVYRATGRHILRQRVMRWRELNPDVVAFEVVHVEGYVVMRTEGDDVTTFPTRDGAPEIDDPRLLEAVRGLEVVAWRDTGSDGRRRFRVVAPAVEEWGRHTFSLVADFSYDQARDQLYASLWLVGGLMAVALVLADRTSWLLARTITRSLDSLHASVRRIRDGHLDERVTVQAEDEIQDLAEAFNGMADNLLKTIDQLREANRELESLDQAKADLVANVSHELKTPLTALRGYLELLDQGELGELSPEAQRAVEVCEKNLTRLGTRIEELVQLSRLEKARDLELVMEEVSIGHMLHGVVETLLPRLEAKGIVCSLNLATDLAPAWGHAEHLERVFLNLLDNAAKFTPDGGHIRVSAEPFAHERRRGVLVRVADTGVGIPAEHLLRIFDRFFQVDPSSRRRFGGMGLGLSLVRSIIEAHHGSVWVESQVGRGSTFFVWVPVPGERTPSSGNIPVRPPSSGKLGVLRVPPADRGIER